MELPWSPCKEFLLNSGYNVTMLDINFIRENAEKVKKATAAKNVSPSIVDRLLKVDAERRKILGEVEALGPKETN